MITMQPCCSHTVEAVHMRSNVDMVAFHALVLQAHKMKRMRQKNKEDQSRAQRLPLRHRAHFVFEQPAMKKLRSHPNI
jgi:hypothetical protein